MADDSTDPDDIKKSFEELFAEMSKKTRQTLSEVLDYQRVVVEDYGTLVSDELDHDNEVLKHLMKLMTEQAVIAVKASRDHRTNVRAINQRLVETHLKFIDDLKEQLDKDRPDAGGEAGPDGPPSDSGAPFAARASKPPRPTRVARPPAAPRQPAGRPAKGTRDDR